MLFLFPPPPTAGSHWSFTISLVLPFPARHIIRIIQYAAFSDWLLSLKFVLQFFPCLFHDFVAHSFLALKNTILSGCTEVYLFSNLLKILASSKLWQWSWIKNVVIIAFYHRNLYSLEFFLIPKVLVLISLTFFSLSPSLSLAYFQLTNLFVSSFLYLFYSSVLIWEPQLCHLLLN